MPGDERQVCNCQYRQQVEAGAFAFLPWQVTPPAFGLFPARLVDQRRRALGE